MGGGGAPLVERQIQLVGLFQGDQFGVTQKASLTRRKTLKDSERAVASQCLEMSILPLKQLLLALPD